jgi:hypothetical protein
MTPKTEAAIDCALDEIKEELFNALENFPAMRSAHEGVAIIEEEFLEFRDAAYWPHKHEVFAEDKEVTQLAAMCVRYLVDVCYKEETPR